MRRIIAFCVVLMLLVGSAGCKQEEKIDTPNVLLPAVYHDGTVYVCTFRQIPGEVDESAIVGYVRSVVPLSQWPEEEGQSNYEMMDAPYAMTGDGMVVLMNQEWTLFEAREEE